MAYGEYVHDGEEYLELSETVAVRARTAFWGSAADVEEFTRFAEECLRVVEASGNPRQVFLETWLIVDHSIRTVLSNILRLGAFNNEDKGLDLRYDLLPSSFEHCVRVLRRVLEVQRSLPEEPVRDRLTASAAFWFFLKKHHGDLLDRLLQLEREYHGDKQPEPGMAVLYAPSFSLTGKAPRYCVNKACVESLAAMDDAWFEMALRLNKVRNKAAHVIDQAAILRALGYSGEDASKRAKQECVNMIGKLLGLVRRPQGEGNK
jgi:hypothetical protein